MLNLDKCKALKQWGMSQELDDQSMYWAEITSNNWEAVPALTWTPRENEKYYKIPSLADIMEFAATLSDEWLMGRRDNEWLIDYYPNEQHPCWQHQNSDPIEAVYQLCEKLEGKSAYICPGPHDWFPFGDDDKKEYFGCRKPRCMASKSEEVKHEDDHRN